MIYRFDSIPLNGETSYDATLPFGEYFNGLIYSFMAMVIDYPGYDIQYQGNFIWSTKCDVEYIGAIDGLSESLGYNESAHVFYDVDSRKPYVVIYDRVNKSYRYVDSDLNEVPHRCGDELHYECGV